MPPSQSRAIVAALRAKGVPVAYVEFEGEQHGFRKAESLVRSLEAELAFYGEVFGFEPAGNCHRFLGLRGERNSELGSPQSPGG